MAEQTIQNLLTEKDKKISQLEKEVENLKLSINKERSTTIGMISQIARIFWGYDDDFNEEMHKIVANIDTNKSFLNQVDTLLALQSSLLVQSKKMHSFLGKLDQYLQDLSCSISKIESLPLNIRNRALEIFNNKSSLSNTDKLLKILSLINTTIKHLENDKNNIKEDFIPSSIANDISQIINSIELTNNENKELESLKDNLKANITYAEAPNLFKNIITSLIKSTNQERKNITGFLNGLNEQISLIQSSLTQNYTYNASVFSASKNNHEKFTVELSDFENDSKDLNKLSLTINQKLSNLNKILHERESFLNIQEKLLKDLNGIGNKITAVKEEAKTFKDTINELTKQKMIDTLTGLNNFYGFVAKLEDDSKKLSPSEKKKLMVGIINIDDFSQINNQYNFSVGDKILRVIGSTLKRQIRETDFLARLGSDRFGIIFYGVNDKNINQPFVNLISTVKAIPFHYHNEKVAVTVSISACSIDKECNASDLVETLENYLTFYKQEHPNTRSHFLLNQNIGDAI